MNSLLKRNIKKLATKFNHQIEYKGNILLLKNNINKIEVDESKKNLLSITYNIRAQIQSIETKPENVYDVLQQLFLREKEVLIKERNGHLITWNFFIETELNEKFWLSVLKKLKAEVDSTEILFREVGGNRILVEYYNGLLIFYDDLNFFKTNIYELTAILKK